MRVKKNINFGIISWFNNKNCMVGSKENYKFDVGVKGLIIYLLGIIVSCLHMFRILHALISLISMWVLIILPGNVMSRTMHYITYLFNYVVINGCDYVWLQTSGNTLRKCCRNSGGPSDILLV